MPQRYPREAPNTDDELPCEGYHAIMYPALPAMADLEALLAVAHAGSISRAARTAVLNQQTMSTRVSRAEKTLGITVFERSPYGVRLTDPGALLISALPDLIQAHTRFLDTVQRLKDTGTARRMTVAVSNTVAEVYYPGWAARFHAAHPAVKMTMVQGNSHEVRELVAGGKIDLGLVEGGRPRHDLAETVLCRDELVLAVPASHPWASAETPITAKQLRKTPLVVREPESGSRALVEEVLGELVEPAGEFGSLSAQRAGMLALGEPTVIPQAAVTDQVTLGDVAIVKAEPLFVRDISAVVRRGSQPSPDIAAFIAVALAYEQLTSAV